MNLLLNEMSNEVKSASRQNYSTLSFPSAALIIITTLNTTMHRRWRLFLWLWISCTVQCLYGADVLTVVPTVHSLWCNQTSLILFIQFDILKKKNKKENDWNSTEIINKTSQREHTDNNLRRQEFFSCCLLERRNSKTKQSGEAW